MRREHRLRIRAALVLAIMGLMITPSWALTDEEIFRDFRFNFINPGARSLGLGGAYIAAASDATAAEANPAALHYVTKSEAFIEYRVSRPDLVSFGPSRSPGVNSPTNPNDFIDFQSFNNREDDEYISFLSFAQPFNIGKRRATLAISRSQVLNVQTSLSDPTGTRNTSLDASLTTFPIVVNPGNPPTVGRYLVRNDVTGRLDADLVHYNAGMSLSLTQHFSLGLTATLAELDMQSQVRGIADDPLGVLDTINPRVNIGGSLNPVQLNTAIDDSDNAIGWAVGLHWHPDQAFPNRDGISPIRFGVVYRKGAELSVAQTTTEQDPISNTPTTVRQIENVLKVPDRFGVGMSYEAGLNWLFSVDVERILYTDLLDDFVVGQNFFTSGIIPQSLLPVDPSNLVFDVDDATVFHAGVEYTRISRGAWNHSIRAGYFNAPDNRIRLDAIDLGPGNESLEQSYLDLFRGGEDVDHFTVGFSVSTPGGLRFEAAGDFSDESTEFVGSAIWRFGRIKR